MAQMIVNSTQWRGFYGEHFSVRLDYGVLRLGVGNSKKPLHLQKSSNYSATLFLLPLGATI